VYIYISPVCMYIISLVSESERGNIYVYIEMVEDIEDNRSRWIEDLKPLVCVCGDRCWRMGYLIARPGSWYYHSMNCESTRTQVLSLFLCVCVFIYRYNNLSPALGRERERERERVASV